MKIIRPPRRRSTSLPSPVCKGKKKALLIGINYDSQDYEVDKGYMSLKTCRKDVLDFKNLLMSECGQQPPSALTDFATGRFDYLETDITVMTDVPENPRLAPTQRNVVSQVGLFTCGLP